jgi:hypothetical protein
MRSTEDIDREIRRTKEMRDAEIIHETEALQHRIDDIKRQIIERYHPTFNSLNVEMAEAQVREDAARVDAARKLLPFPEGTVLEQWHLPSTWSRNRVRTGRRGTLVVITPTNAPDKGYYTAGGIAVRVLKKDGTPSKIFKRYNSQDWREPTQEGK